MDTEIRLYYIESDRRIEAARMLQIADARSLSTARRQPERLRVDALSRIAALLRPGGWHQRDAPAAPKPSGGTDVRSSF